MRRSMSAGIVDTEREQQTAANAPPPGTLPNRLLERLRAAINWGMARTPPLLAKSSFHSFGVRLNNKAEVSRDRRIPRDEEKRLLDTALEKMSAPEHQYAGKLLHDRIIGALELCCRRGEMLLIQNKRVNWDTCQIGIPGATAKDKENRRIPFNPKGRLAAILKRRRDLGPDAYVFGSTSGGFQPTLQTGWETLKLLANGHTLKTGAAGIKENQKQLRQIDGTTCGTKARAASWLTAWTSGSFS